MPTKHYWDFKYYVVGLSRTAVAASNNLEDAEYLRGIWSKREGVPYRIKERNLDGSLG